MEDSPLVSFLIVAFNAGRFLRDAVASARQQTHPNIEVVLVDNASTDDSVRRLVEELSAGVAVRVVRSDVNRGPAGGAVLGLPHCRGEFIARLDADDVALPERVEEQLKHFRRHPELDAVGADVLVVDSNGRPQSLRLALRPGWFLRLGSRWHIGCPHTTLMLRRRTTAERFYNPSLFASEDFELIEWFGRKQRLGIVRKVLCLYRDHDFAITRRLPPLQRRFGSEVLFRISAAGTCDVKRLELATEDFSWLTADLAVMEGGQARRFEQLCVERGDWLGAAYFASIGPRRVLLPLHLGRALWAGRNVSDVAALVLCRTVWPLFTRVENAGLRILCLAVAQGEPKLPPNAAAFRTARRVNTVKAAFHFLPAVIVTGAIVYLALKPLPTLSDVLFLPHTVARFFGYNDFLANLVGFSALAVIVHATFDEDGGRRTPRFFGRLVAMAALVIVLETAQLWIPKRHFDLMDIFAGLLGVGLGGVPWLLSMRRDAQTKFLRIDEPHTSDNAVPEGGKG